jgi:hypothetical protein
MNLIALLSFFARRVAAFVFVGAKSECSLPAQTANPILAKAALILPLRNFCAVFCRGISG